jgi:hypothetical protein
MQLRDALVADAKDEHQVRAEAICDMARRFFKDIGDLFGDRVRGQHIIVSLRCACVFVLVVFHGQACVRCTRSFVCFSA